MHLVLQTKHNHAIPLVRKRPKSVNEEDSGTKWESSYEEKTHGGEKSQRRFMYSNEYNCPLSMPTMQDINTKLAAKVRYMISKDCLCHAFID